MKTQEKGGAAVAVIIIILLLILGWFALVRSDDDAATDSGSTTAPGAVQNGDTMMEDNHENDEEKDGDDAMMEEGEETKGDDAMMEEGEEKEGEAAMTEEEGGEAMMEGEEKTDETATAPVGTYATYSADAVTASDAAKKIIFFHASWCPSCRTLDGEIESSASDIPGDVALFKADYDAEKDLKKKYGVTGQHTLVQVDAEGNMITKWQGTNTLAQVLAKLQ